MTATKSAPKPIRSLGVGLGLFAVLLQLLLPLGLAVASEGSQQDAYRFGLCLSDDGRKLFLGFDDPTEKTRSYECPACIASKDVPLAVPPGDAVSLSLPQSYHLHHPVAADTISISAEAQHGPWIRGPPLL